MSFVQAPAKETPLTRRERTVFMKLIAHLLDDSMHRLQLQTKLISLVMAITYLMIGAGYAFAGSKALGNPHAYVLLLNIERNLRVHGVILMVLGAGVLYTSANYRLASRIALVLMGFYSLVTALLVAGGWLLGQPGWPAPWWYLAIACVCLILVRVSPLVNIDQPRGADRSERA